MNTWMIFIHSFFLYCRVVWSGAKTNKTNNWLICGTPYGSMQFQQKKTQLYIIINSQHGVQNIPQVWLCPGFRSQISVKPLMWWLLDIEEQVKVQFNLVETACSFTSLVYPLLHDTFQWNKRTVTPGDAKGIQKTFHHLPSPPCLHPGHRLLSFLGPPTKWRRET